MIISLVFMKGREKKRSDNYSKGEHREYKGFRFDLKAPNAHKNLLTNNPRFKYYNILKKKRSIYKIFNFIMMLVLILPVKDTHENIYSRISYITLKINTTGNQYIYYHNIINLCTPEPPKPDEIYINEVNQSEINSSYYFNNTESNIKLIWKNIINITQCMFEGCSKIIEINFSNFDSSQVTNMGRMFWGCSSLTSLDLSNFETSLVTDMSLMFCDCSSLTSLDLSSFNTSQVTSMYRMFEDCSKLISLDLSNFNTTQVTSMSNMFESCSSLAYLI